MKGQPATQERLSAIATEFLRRPIQLTPSQVDVLRKTRHFVVERQGTRIYSDIGKRVPPAESADLDELFKQGLVDQQGRATRKYGSEEALAPSGDGWDLLQWLEEQGL